MDNLVNVIKTKIKGNRSDMTNVTINFYFISYYILSNIPILNLHAFHIVLLGMFYLCLIICINAVIID